MSDAIAALLTAEPPPLRSLAPQAPAELERITEKCLAKKREARYQSAEELLAELKTFRPGHQAEWAAATRRVEGAGARLALRRWPVAAAIAAMLIVGLIVGLVWFLSWRGAPAVEPDQIKSLVVLPLENLSGDPAQEYFADGMTDAVIGELAKIGALRVISRTSAMRYKGTKQALREIARELKVDAIIEGTVLRSGDRVHLRARLIRATTDQHLWAGSYDSDLRDAMALQSQVARAIAREIRIKITPDEQARMANTRPVNHKAYNDYLLGSYYWNKRTEEHLRRAIDYFQSAIREDASYAPAYAGLADCYTVLAVMFGDPREFFPKAKAAATKSLEIDGTLAEAHTVMASVIAYYDWDWQGAEREYKRATELDPGYAPAHQRYSLFLMRIGRTEESLAESKRALDLDPVSLVINSSLGTRLYDARQYDQATRQLRKTLEMDPNFFLARIELGSVVIGALPPTEARRRAAGDAMTPAPAEGTVRKRLRRWLHHR